LDSVLIIGAGAAGSVVAKKCAMNRDVFKRIHLASRRLESCKKVQAAAKTPIDISQVDADQVEETVALIARVKPDLVINMALPYQDLPIMDACLEARVHYMDTANYEPRDVAKFEYSWQWAYQDKYKAKGLMAVLGCGFDPGVTNVFCAYAQEKLYDEIHTIDIIDCNAGSHGKKFATNFNPEINIREVTQRGRYWEDGRWIEVDPLSVAKTIDFYTRVLGMRKTVGAILLPLGLLLIFGLIAVVGASVREAQLEPGIPPDAARVRLEAQPLTPEVIYSPAKAGQRVNVVLRQFPEGGTLSSFGHVTLVLPKPLHGTVPKVTGLVWKKAKAKLQRLKLKVVLRSGPGKPGRVLAQFPRAGVAAAPGMQVSITVGTAASSANLTFIGKTGGTRAGSAMTMGAPLNDVANLREPADRVIGNG
jgi:hypothetical protein